MLIIVLLVGNISVVPLASYVSNIIVGPWDNNVGDISVSLFGSNISNIIVGPW